MADTETHANGIENGLDEEDLTKLRPADIDADVKEMERRKRVEMIMNSKLFREELERIIEMQMKDGNGPAGLLQQISDMMGIQAGKLHTTHMFRGTNCVTPINDIRGVENMAYAKGEKLSRCKLASVFRLMDLYGWSHGIQNMITVRLNQDEEHFLANPHGMLYNEITASSLVKVDMQGNVVEHGTTNFTVNTQVFLLHSSIHASRPDIKCIIHIHTPSVLAVSSLKCGLLPLCQEALVIGEVSQHPFVSGIFEPEEREKIIRNLGPTNKILFLNNHGALCCGETVEEAFYNVYNTVLACETQMKLMPVGIDNLVLVNDETRKQVYDAAHRPSEVDGEKKKQFRVGELEFEALIRMLDNAGFRTGYIYRHPLVKGEIPKPKNDVEVPPAVSSLGYLIEEEKLYKQGNWKKYIDGRNRLDRTKWLNSPNVYQKVEILETGTPDPKKITKWVDQNSEEWVAENSPTHSSTPVKIDSALQFVPKNTNPKEFKKLQQQIKKNRLDDKITSGPQSHILEGVSWEEAKKLQDANITQTGDQVILFGAASKGIIQRNYQHNALVYKAPYAKNPFDSISDKEIEEYKRLVERKQRGDTDYEESQSESEAVSSRQEALRRIKSPLMSPQSATSETEEESRDEPRVLRIETKTAPQPIQAEVVLSDAEFDTTDARVERSQSARYPKAEKPESVTIVNSFRKSWSLKRDKEKNKDIDSPDVCVSRMEPSVILTKCYSKSEEELHSCIARITNLKHKPIIIDTGIHRDGGMFKSASDPCNLSILSEYYSDRISLFDDCHTESSDSDSIVDLKRKLKLRKKLIHSAKMKFLGFDYEDIERTGVKGDGSPGSRVRVLISEIRDKIIEVMSPNGNEEGGGIVSRGKNVRRNFHDEFFVLQEEDGKSFPRVASDGEVKVGSQVHSEDSLKDDTENSVMKRKFFNKEFSPHGSLPEESSSCLQLFTSSQDPDAKTDVRLDAHVVKSLLMQLVNQVESSTQELTYTIASDSDAQTSSFTGSTETEWYYNKTILKPDNSQTVLEVKGVGNEVGNFAKQSDTGIETDFKSEKDNGNVENDSSLGTKVLDNQNSANDTDVLENSAINKSSETDSSFLKSGSGRTGTDIDTSYAFKTETESSEKNAETIEIDEESLSEEKVEEVKKSVHNGQEPFSKLPDIPESPEFTNVDTEDAPITSSSKGSSPEVNSEVNGGPEKEQSNQKCEEEHVRNDTKQKKSGKKRKRNKKGSSTKITVKKEVTENNSEKPVVSEIKLTIKNNNSFAKESYEFEIQDLANTSEEMSVATNSPRDSIEGYQSYELVEGNCDCDAQQNLEVLQSEVGTTIEKLQMIETYFVDEINRSGNDLRECSQPEEEMVITYNYKEAEEVLANDASASLASNIQEVSGENFVASGNVDRVAQGESLVNTTDGYNALKLETEVPEVSCNIEIAYEPEVDDKIDFNGDSIEPVGNFTLDDLIDLNGLLSRIITESEKSKSKISNTINDIDEFILNDEETPSEFEDTEHVISISESTILDSGECNQDGDSLAEEEEPDETREENKKKQKRSGSGTFNVLIATPSRKEIFINYNEKASSSFSLAPDTEVKCNSYINTDDVNEDFEESPEWFSAGSPMNSSYMSAASSLERDSSPVNVCICNDCGEFPVTKISSGPLAIIEEVEEQECGQNHSV